MSTDVSNDNTMQFDKKDNLLKTENQKFVKIKRVFSKDGVHPFDEVDWTTSHIHIQDMDGNVMFDHEVEHPITWNKISVRTCADKYFKTKNLDNHPMGGERSIRDVIHRVSYAISQRGYAMEYVDEEGAKILYDEICWLILNQHAAFNSPVFFNWGLYDVYGFKGNDKSKRWAIEGREGKVFQQESEYENSQGSACFILEVDDELVNGNTGIYDWINTEMSIFSNGSGSGLNASRIRGEGESITGGGKSSGLISFLRVADTSASAIKSGGKTRRAAKMIILDDDHPDLLEFINWKKEQEFIARSLILNGYDQTWSSKNGAYQIIQAQNANNSIATTEKFLNAVMNNEEWKTYNRVDKEVNKTYKAKEVFDEIIDAAWECGDPGLFYIDTINSWNTIPNTGKIRSSNPCVTGDTLVATADGRNAVSIKQLAEEGKDVPVYSLNKEGLVEVKMGRNPRITGKKKKILSVTLDNGMVVKCTENHKFILRNGDAVEAKHLIKGDSLFPFNKWQTIPKKRQGVMTPYWMVARNTSHARGEHKIIMEHYLGHPVEKNFCVHHKDFDSLNNSIDNLEYLTFKEHSKIHALDYESNPMQNGWWNKVSKKEREIYRKKMSKSTSGKNNGRYKDISSNEIFEHAEKLALRLRRSFTENEWNEYAKENNLLIGLSKYRKNKLGSINSISRKTAEKLNLPIIPKSPYKAGNFVNNVENYYAALNSGYVHVRPKDETYYPIVTKKCEHCNREFELEWWHRETCFCSHSCSSKSAWDKNKDQHIKRIKLSHENKKEQVRISQINAFNDLKIQLEREPQKKEWISFCRQKNVSTEISRPSSPFRNWKSLKESAGLYNHRVVSVEEAGFEDVYNITVDDNHTYASVIEDSTTSGMPKYSGFFQQNCGEFLQPDHSSCNLASLNLLKFYNIDHKMFDTEKFTAAIEVFVTAMEIIVAGSSYPTKEIAKITRDTRPLGLGYCNMGGLIMVLGYPYDSDQARSVISTITSLETAIAYRQSARIASVVGSFPEYDKNKTEFNKIIRRHRDINNELKTRIKFAKQIHQASQEAWEDAVNLINRHGARNSQVTVIAPTGTIMMLMGTTINGIEPCFSLTSIKLMSDGSFVKLICNEVATALKELGYSDSQVKEINDYVIKNGYIENAPHLNPSHVAIFDTANVSGGRKSLY